MGNYAGSARHRLQKAWNRWQKSTNSSDVYAWAHYAEG